MCEREGDFSVAGAVQHLHGVSGVVQHAPHHAVLALADRQPHEGHRRAGPAVERVSLSLSLAEREKVRLSPHTVVQVRDALGVREGEGVQQCAAERSVRGVHALRESLGECFEVHFSINDGLVDACDMCVGREQAVCQTAVAAEQQQARGVQGQATHGVVRAQREAERVLLSLTRRDGVFVLAKAS